MTPDDPTSLVDLFLSQGLPGGIIVSLVYFILMLRKELREERAAHKVELASKDALINELYEERIKEARSGYEIARANHATLDALVTAMRAGKAA